MAVRKGTRHPSVIMKCTCKNEWQDTRYGKEMRLMNEKQGKAAGYKCTVCKTVHQR